MKKIILSSVLTASAFSLYAAPMVTIGDQLDLFVNGGVIGSYNSNITLTQSPLKTSDYIGTVRIGAEADYGRNSKFKANVKFYEDLVRYLQNAKFNCDLANVFAKVSYTETRLTVDGNFSFQQVRQNSATISQVGNLVKRNLYNAGVLGSYEWTEKVSSELGFSWYREQFTDYTDVYSNSDVYSMPVNALYRVTEKIKVGLAYQFRYSDFSGGTNTYGDNRTDNFGGVTVRGDLWSKLSTVVYLGVMNRDIPDIETDTTFTGSVRFEYAVTEKITTYLKAFRDFGNGASRQSSINTGVDVGATYNFSEFVQTRAGFIYQNSDYQAGYDRNDNEVVPHVGISYTPTKFITFSANYRYLNNASNIDNCAYNQHLVDLSIMMRY